MDLKNKVALITGASSGIGKAVAQNLDVAGMKLVMTARSQDKLDQLASNLQEAKVIPGEITASDLPSINEFKLERSSTWHKTIWML